MSKEEKVIHRVTGVSFYACVHTPNKAADKYTIDLSVDKETSKKLKALGLSPTKTLDGKAKHHEEGKDTFKFKRNVQLPDGTPLNGPRVYGEDGTLTTALVGNGSVVQVAFTVYTGKLKTGKEYVSTNLLGVKVDKLVEYTSSREPLFEGVKDSPAPPITEDPLAELGSAEDII